MSLNTISPIVVFNGVSMTTNRTSTPVHIQYTDNVGIQFVWTGSPTGTFGVDVSNTATLNQDGTISGGTWTSLVLLSPNTPQATGSAGNGYIDLSQLSAAFVRATYTYSSGSGTLTATLTAKPI